MRAVIRYTAVGLACAIGVAVVWRVYADRFAVREIQLELHAEPLRIGADLGARAISLRLTALDVPPREADEGELSVSIDGDQSTLRVAVGDSVALNEIDYEVAAIRAWSGLLHRAPGEAMINVAIKPFEGEWIENVFVPLGAWKVIPPSLAVHAMSSDADFTVAGARWGVVEGDRTHWFTSFVAGTGIELDDGTVVTLLAREPSARILIEFARAGESSREWFEANALNDASPIRHEDPSAMDVRVEILIDDVDRATVSIVEDDLQLLSATVGLGEIISDATASVRVDQFERDAFPLLAAESPYLEAVLASDDRVLRVREGELMRVRENSVAFEAIAKPREASAELELDGMATRIDERATLTAGHWRIDAFRALNPSEAAFRLVHEESRLRARLAGTAACIGIAIAILALARRRT